VLAFSLNNPGGRIAARAVDRAAGGRALDAVYLEGLSADALPALEAHAPATARARAARAARAAAPAGRLRRAERRPRPGALRAYAGPPHELHSEERGPRPGGGLSGSYWALSAQ
jgi:hypothetical protein